MLIHGYIKAATARALAGFSELSNLPTCLTLWNLLHTIILQAGIASSEPWNALESPSAIKLDNEPTQSQIKTP